MGYRKKEDCIKEAERLGIDVAGMNWPALQKAVSDALKLESLGVDVNQSNMEMLDEVRGAIIEVVKEHDVKAHDAKADPLIPYLDKHILMSPELSPERYRLVKYDEDLGSELEVEEREFDIDRETDEVFDKSGGKISHDNRVDAYHDYTTGTYRIKNRSDRRVIGMASVPKENPQLSFRPGVDWATVVTFKGKSGYLWKHWRYPNVSALLKAAGDEYYQKYRKVFKEQPNVWYACGHLVCDPYLVHQVLHEIQEDAQQRAEDRQRRRKMWEGGVL